MQPIQEGQGHHPYGASLVSATFWTKGVCALIAHVVVAFPASVKPRVVWNFLLAETASDRTIYRRALRPGVPFWTTWLRYIMIAAASVTAAVAAAAVAAAAREQSPHFVKILCTSHLVPDFLFVRLGAGFRATVVPTVTRTPTAACSCL